MGSGVAALMETNRLLGPQRLPSPACTHISPPCTTPREKPPGRTGLHGDCRGQTSGSTSAHFRARPVLQGNERRLRTAASAGDRGVSARSGAPGTTHRRRASPAHRLARRSLSGLPGAGARPRARTHSLTQGLAHAHSALLQPRPASLPPPAPVAPTGRGRSQGEKKKKPPPLKISYPLIFPVTHWDERSGRPECFPTREVSTTAPA